ncbi:hypothetical protein [Saccharothrix deserti]|uniref:hypothetical protein n=1 Tax=Saccharothrix deserti TaxID=2593674 RepID=UPI00131B9874|nr:hypothetical protein [Saccharothrix deserti]
MGELFTDMDLFGAEQGDLFEGDVDTVDAPATVEPVATVEDVMPATWELIPMETITGQGVLGA